MNIHQLQNKVIFITGGGGQLGLSSVQMFLERGAKIIANDIVGIDQSPQMMEIQKRYDEKSFHFIEADMCDEEQVQEAFVEIEQRFGRLDGLFHNVYKQAQKPILDLSLLEWNDVINGSLTSTFLVCKHAVGLMIKTGGGSIVNTSSIISTSAFRKKGNAAYGAAKAGMNQFTRILAVENADQGIRANVLMPGALSTEEKIRDMDPKRLQLVRDKVPLGHFGKTNEVAELAAFLLSDASSYVTSSIYHVDGGY